MFFLPILDVRLVLLAWNKSATSIGYGAELIFRRQSQSLRSNPAPMKLHKLIFRIDFARVNARIMSNPGLIVDTLYKRGDDFWNEFQDNPGTRTIGAKRANDDGSLCQFTVAPSNINFLVESVKPIEWGTMETDANISAAFHIIDDLQESMEIRKLNRIGIRFNYLSNVRTKSSVSDFRSDFCHQFSSGLIAAVKTIAGTPDDFGVSIDGKHDDGIAHHTRFGPQDPSKMVQYFSEDVAKALSSSSANMFFDLDFYQDNLDLTIHSRKWVRTPFHRSEELVKRLTTVIEATKNGDSDA